MHCMFFASKNLVVVSNIFYFHPYLGKWSNLTNIFQMGWNHQLKTHFIPFPWFLYSSKDLEELLGPKNKIGISGGTTDVWHLTDDKSQNFIRILIIMVIVLIVLDDALLCLCCWCGCSFLLHGRLPMAYVFVLRRQFVCDPSVSDVIGPSGPSPGWCEATQWPEGCLLLWKPTWNPNMEVYFRWFFYWREWFSAEPAVSFRGV